VYSTQKDPNGNRSAPGAYDLVIEEGRIETRKKRRRRRIGGSKDSPWYLLGVVGQLGYIVALPIAGGALLGKGIDGKLGTYPRTTLSLLVVGVLIAGVGFVRTLRDVAGMERRKN
jgi:hypothetical protein